MARASNFNKNKVWLSFDKVSIIIKCLNMAPSNICNINDTGITTVQKPNKVVA